MPRNRRIGLQRGRESAPQRQPGGGTEPEPTHGQGAGRGQGAAHGHGHGRGGGRGGQAVAAAAFAVITAKAATGAVNPPVVPVMIRGVINADGTIASGSGFTVGSPPNGVFSISFTAPFSSAPVVVATGGAGATNRDFVNYDNLRAAGVDIYVKGNAGAPDTTTPLSFIAVAVTPAVASPPMIRGVINTDGTIASGSGFTVGPAPGGHFVITFTTPFPTAPAVVAIGGKGATNFDFVNYDALSTNGVDVYLKASTGFPDVSTPLAFVAFSAG